MEETVVNFACDKVALYDENGNPRIGIPVGWPEHKTFIDRSTVFNFSPEEIEQKYGVRFPVHSTDSIMTSETPEAKEFSEGIRVLDAIVHFPSGRRVKTNYDTVDNYVQRGEKFFLLINLMDSNHFYKPVFKLPDNILNAVNAGLCKIMITFLCEGHSRECEHVNWLCDFGSLNQLNPTNYYYVHSNFKFNTVINKSRAWYGHIINFKYIPVPYFEYSAWFLNRGYPYIPESNLIYKEKYWEFLNSNRNKSIRKHFNILNRRPRYHRVLLFTEVMSNTLLANSSEISLNGEQDLIKSNEFIRKYIKSISENYPEYTNNYNFALNHDFLIPKVLDANLDVNRAGEFTRDFYEKSFCSVTSETLINDDVLFFSEKTFKPIFNMHPFLFLGNPHSLKKLREFGYKTFDRWWDESYDEEVDYLLRIKKLSKVMQEIATWSHEKCIQTTQEMEEVLVHNFFNYLDNTRYEDFMIELYNSHNGNKLKKTLI